MLIGILETGKMADHLADEFGHYPDLFQRLYQSVDPNIEVRAWEVVSGHFPEAPDLVDAWLITGSRHGVYDGLPWIEPLKTFLLEVREARVPLIGICFGHQILAEAFGGRAVKSEKGWGCGVHDYDFVLKPDWIEGDPSSFSMHAMHQDQVIALPDDAHTLASSAFCKHAMVAYGDPARPDAISIQAHPEFTDGLSDELVRFRRTSHIPEQIADEALKTLGRVVDGNKFVSWSVEFVHQHSRASRAA
ncbi:MAG: type 1 glutamine amidotransferase [Pseudomonadota bacterium]